MSGEALGWAKRQTAPTRGCKTILICMADYASKEGFAFPKLSSLAVETQLAERHVRRSLGHLCEAGLLREYHVVCSRTGRTRTRLYWFPIRSAEPEAGSVEQWALDNGARVVPADEAALVWRRGKRSEVSRMSPSPGEAASVAGVPLVEDSGVPRGRTHESPLKPLPEQKRSDDLFSDAHYAETALFEAALAAYPESGLKWTDEGKAREAWDASVKLVGRGERLLGAVRAMAADPALKGLSWGSCSLQRWLSEKRWRAWLAQADRLGADGARPGGVADGRAIWPGPVEIRDAMIAQLGLAAVQSYLDTAGWDEVGGRILTRFAIGADRLNGEAGPLLRALNITAEPMTRSNP